jgi:TonB-linked SusC/RagA family outer membrane protein
MRRFSFLALLALLPALALAQAPLRYTFRGVVQDASGEPLPGVVVEVQNQRVGGVTDGDGRYSFEASLSPGAYTLAYRYVGYATRTINVALDAGNTTVTNNVTLREDAVGLDEVVVTGASPTATRRSLGNALSVVDASALENTASPNPLSGLTGRVAGAQVTQNSGDPAGGFSLRLRGVSSLKGSADPLYIVDGVIVDNSSTNVINLSGDAMLTAGQFGQNRLVDLNPSDIERIEVLNGAAAAAIYGSRASNGVVQIFTKRGQGGRPRIEYSASVGMNQLRKQTFLSEHGSRFGVKGSERLETTQDRLTTLLTLGFTEAQLQQRGIKYVKVGPGAGRILITDQYAVQRYNYWDDIFRTSYGADQNLSIAGGQNQTQYYLSFGALSNGGIVENTRFDKYTGRLRLDQQLTSWANLSVGLAYAYSKSQDMPVGTNFFSPVSTVYIIDNVWNLNERDAAGNLRQVEPVRVNPLSVIETFDLSQVTNRTTGSVSLNLLPLAGLTVNGVLGVDTYGLVGTEFHPRLPYSGVSADFFPDGYVSQAKSNVLLMNADLTASYERAFGANFRSTTTAGYQYSHERQNYTAQQGRDLAPFVRTLAAAANYFTTPVETRAERIIYGGFVQETVGWKEQLYLTGALRLDGSAAFSGDNNPQRYVKASVSWVPSELWKDNDGLTNRVSTAKLRASYGQAGNLTGIGPYDRFPNYLLGVYGGLAAINPSRTLADPDVSPERMDEYEAGVDLGFFRNRFGLSATVYRQRVRDLLLDLPLPPTAGGRSIVTNVDDPDFYIQNTGFELVANANVLRRGDFSWDAALTYSRNRNVVRGLTGVLALRGSDGPQYAIDGQPFGVFYGRYYARNEDGSFRTTAQGLRQPARGLYDPAKCSLADQRGCETLDATGQPTGTELRRIIGSPDPDWTGALNMDVTWKKLSLHTLFDAAIGQDVYNWNRITGNNVGHGALAEQELKGEVPRGTVASVAGGVTGQRIQEEHVEDGSFVKLRELGLSYDFGRIGRSLESVTLGIVGRNLVSWDDYTGFDPETNAAGQSDRVRGDDFGNVPIPRTITVRLGLRF